jgi:shikimate dehydrogenase
MNEGRVGLIGDPVEHSLSPAFQQAAFDATGLGWRYELWPTAAAAVPARVARLASGDMRGANVTVPHKEAVFELLAVTTELARRVGAVNTIVRDGARLWGDNTDVPGFLAPLKVRGFDFERCQAVVLGAGGAARRGVFSLLDAGVRRVTVVNRSVERANALAVSLADPRIDVAPTMNAHISATSATLLVNATSLGWSGAALPCNPATFAALPAGALAYDLTYRDTPFLRAAAQAGVATLDGLPMLVEQGACSFELWTGLEAPRALMWDAAVAARAARIHTLPAD